MKAKINEEICRGWSKARRDEMGKEQGRIPVNEETKWNDTNTEHIFSIFHRVLRTKLHKTLHNKMYA